MIRDRFSGLYLASNHHAAESVFKKITLWLEEPQGILQLITQYHFKRWFGNTSQGVSEVNKLLEDLCTYADLPSLLRLSTSSPSSDELAFSTIIKA